MELSDTARIAQRAVEFDQAHSFSRYYVTTRAHASATVGRKMTAQYACQEFPMDLPQLVGLRCSSCNKTISSIAEGEFCTFCYNPIHHACKPSDDAEVPEGRCDVCGADPQSSAALEVKAEAEKERHSGHTQVFCPNCGSTQGFSPYEGGNPATDSLSVLGLFPFWLIKAMGNVGQVQCRKCDFIFRPQALTSNVGCLILVVLGVIGVFAIALIRVLG